MKLTGCCLPYGESKYHDAVMPGAFAHQDGQSVPLVTKFNSHNPEHVIGHCVLHNTTEGVMCDLYFNEQYLKKAMNSYSSIENLYWALAKLYKIGAWVTMIKKEPNLMHDKIANSFIVTHGCIREVAINETCIESIKMVEE